MVIVLMGVAGSGKTTIGRALAAALGWPFRDADDFHPPTNIAKMTAGVPLTDADRMPWLASIRSYIDETLARQAHAVVGCSALKAQYRAVLQADPISVQFVHLRGDPALIRARLDQRVGHFMSGAMLESQLATLEPPSGVLTVDIAQPPEAIVTEIRQQLRLA